MYTARLRVVNTGQERLGWRSTERNPAVKTSTIMHSISGINAALCSLVQDGMTIPQVQGVEFDAGMPGYKSNSNKLEWLPVQREGCVS